MPPDVLVPKVTVPALMPRSVNRLAPFRTRLPDPVFVIEPGPKMVFASVNTPGPLLTMPAPAVEIALVTTRPETPATSVVPHPRG